MKVLHGVAAAVIGFSFGAGYLGSGRLQNDKLNADSLKNIAEGLGYDVKVLSADAGKEKYEIALKTENLNIPVGLEISATTNYVWLTVNLGPNSAKKKHEELLKSNFNIQPCFFYITTKGTLMCATAIDNRGISAAILKRCLEKISSDVDKTSKIWQD